MLGVPCSDDVAIEFLARYLSDREAGRERGLEDYLAAFPGQSAVIAREYALPAIAEELDPRPDALAGAGGLPMRLGCFVLEAEIGRGAQGVVLRSRDRQGGRVAVKLLPWLGGDDEERLARFHREVDAAKKLDHPGICPIHEAGLEHGLPYIVMPHVEGETLARRIRRERQARKAPAVGRGRAPGPEEERRLSLIVGAVEKLARALHAAHEHGITHRDVKPENVMITPDGSPMLMDFGLARIADGAHPTLTRTGAQVGTPAYMAPEQLTAGRNPIDRRVDVWSLGVTLYEWATLRHPFAVGDGRLLPEAIRRREPRDPRRLEPAVSRALAVVMKRTLRKGPARRYASALELADDLRRVRERRPLAHRPFAWRWPCARHASRLARLAPSLAMLAALVTGDTRPSGDSSHAIGERTTTRDQPDPLEQSRSFQIVIPLRPLLARLTGTPGSGPPLVLTVGLTLAAPDGEARLERASVSPVPRATPETGPGPPPPTPGRPPDENRVLSPR